jgi:hypothetical protein
MISSKTDAANQVGRRRRRRRRKEGKEEEEGADFHRVVQLQLQILHLLL